MRQLRIAVKDAFLEIVRIMKKILFCSLFMLIFSSFCFCAPEGGVVTAASFFSRVSDKYATISNYVANVTIKNGKTVQSGILRYRKPNFVRLDFFSPRGQFIIFANDMLTIYLPNMNVVLSQRAEGANSGSALGTAAGLSLMKRSYIISFEKDSRPHPLYEGSREMAIILSMERRTGSEPFRKLRVMINPETNLIRRIEGTPTIGDDITFDFSDYKINPGVPGGFFVFEAEHDTTILNDFLYFE